MEREIRYCTTEDGVRIAYCMEGEGPALVLVPVFSESVSLDHMMPEWQEFCRSLGQGRRLIRYDGRGTGLSQREDVAISPAGLLYDLEAVVRSAGVRRVSIWAQTIGGPRAVQFAASHSSQTDRLILYGTFHKPTDTMPPQNLQALAELARANWPMASQTLADMSNRFEFPESSLLLAQMIQESTTGRVAALLLEAAYASDVSELLPLINVPALIVHRLEDGIVPFAISRDMASRLPKARLVPLEGRAHFPTMGDSESILRAVEDFLRPGAGRATRKPARASAGSTFRTVLFTDLVGHTEMMSRLGDERGRAVLREHERITREVLKAHGGTEVKTMGDGFMASFASVTRAVECAVALQRAIDERNRGVGAKQPPAGVPNSEEIPAVASPLQVRIGLNAGEPIEEEGDLFGATVILASRIAARAGGGEILVADTVRGLCSGKGFLFADRGEFVAKGFEDPVRVYEVSWRAEG